MATSILPVQDPRSIRLYPTSSTGGQSPPNSCQQADERFCDEHADGHCQDGLSLPAAGSLGKKLSCGEAKTAATRTMPLLTHKTILYISVLYSLVPESQASQHASAVSSRGATVATVCLRLCRTPSYVTAKASTFKALKVRGESPANRQYSDLLVKTSKLLAMFARPSHGFVWWRSRRPLEPGAAVTVAGSILCIPAAVLMLPALSPKTTGRQRSVVGFLAPAYPEAVTAA